MVTSTAPIHPVLGVLTHVSADRYKVKPNAIRVGTPRVSHFGFLAAGATKHSSYGAGGRLMGKILSTLRTLNSPSDVMVTVCGSMLFSIKCAAVSFVIVKISAMW